ncbi:hypothetical protein [Nocardia otitidiscaviarum]|nr:hypothetical protein [Nocardia otitidiscaviarum]
MAMPQHTPDPPDTSAFRGCLYTLAAYGIVVSFGVVLGALAWLLDWSCVL